MAPGTTSREIELCETGVALSQKSRDDVSFSSSQRSRLSQAGDELRPAEGPGGKFSFASRGIAFDANPRFNVHVWSLRVSARARGGTQGVLICKGQSAWRSAGAVHEGGAPPRPLWQERC